MRRNLDLTGGLLMAESVTARLAPALGRLPAHELVERPCHRAVAEDRSLRDVLLEAPEIADPARPGGGLRRPCAGGYLGAAGELVARAGWACESCGVVAHLLFEGNESVSVVRLVR